MENTKSDWFEVIDEDGQIYELEIFGVTRHTKHCMRLLKDREEIEVFHLADVQIIRNKYNLKYMNMMTQRNRKYSVSIDLKIPFTKHRLMENSDQLKREGLGVVHDYTKKLRRLL